MALSKILPASQEVQAVGKNLIINGNFDVWQRGVTIDPVSSSLYGVDRWANFYSSINAQQTFALGQTDVDGIVKYSSRWTAKTTSGTAPFTRIEDVTRLGGKLITVSFYAKASTQVTVDLRFAQRFGSGGSATAFDTITDALAITTSWQKFTYTRTLASISGKTVGSGNNTEFAILATDLTTNDWIELSQVQLELGEQATPFEHRSYGEELLLCKRYLHVYGGGVDEYPVTGVWSGGSSDGAIFPFTFAEMRAAPTVTSSAASTFKAVREAVGWSTGNSVSFLNVSKRAYTMLLSTDSDTRGYASRLHITSSAYIHADAEL